MSENAEHDAAAPDASTPKANLSSPESKTSGRQQAWLEMIKITWDDVHHSRMQDWQFFLAIGGIAAAMMTMKPAEVNWAMVACLLAAGALVSGVAAMIAWNHWKLHSKKFAYIEGLEWMLAAELGPLPDHTLPYDDRDSEPETPEQSSWDSPETQILVVMYTLVRKPAQSLKKPSVCGLICTLYATTMAAFALATFVLMIPHPSIRGPGAAAWYGLFFFGVAVVVFARIYVILSRRMKGWEEVYRNERACIRFHGRACSEKQECPTRSELNDRLLKQGTQPVA